jgi:hypothetical protein
VDEDHYKCLWGSVHTEKKNIEPCDVRRVKHIFNSPTFFADGPGANEVTQGGVGDCWLLAAMGALSTMPALLERICPAVSSCVAGVSGVVSSPICTGSETRK